MSVPQRSKYRYKPLRNGARCPICGGEPHLRGFNGGYLAALASRLFEVEPAELSGPSKTNQLVQARAFVTWAMRTLGRPRSYTRIGQVIGRDHASAINLHVKAIDLAITDADFAAICASTAQTFYDLRSHDHGHC